MREYLKNIIYKNNSEEALLAYKMMAYIFATNRTTIKELKGDQRLAIQSNPDYFRQFILTSSDPAKERIFMVSKKKLGSFFCWHGSSMENWFSIMRNGLRNLSNSHMMTAGAAYGQGIYASSNFATSYGYSTRYTGGTKTWAKNTLQQQYVIAIVEIINKDGYKKDPGGNIVVVPDENDIILRYLFVYNQSSTYPSNELNTWKMGFEEHYVNYVKNLASQKASDRAKRIDIAYKKFLARKQQEEEQKVRLAKGLKEKEEQELSKVLDERIDKMKSKVQGKGSVMATQRIMVEYKAMLQSKDFKGLMKIDVPGDNFYTWKITFDLSKYEISKELKADFEERK